MTRSYKIVCIFLLCMVRCIFFGIKVISRLITPAKIPYQFKKNGYALPSLYSNLIRQPADTHNHLLMTRAHFSGQHQHLFQHVQPVSISICSLQSLHSKLTLPRLKLTHPRLLLSSLFTMNANKKCLCYKMLPSQILMSFFYIRLAFSLI